jgi:hypothetical protein
MKNELSKTYFEASVDASGNAVLCSTCIHPVTICDQGPGELNFDNTIDSSDSIDCCFRSHYIKWIKAEVEKLHRRA